MSSPLNYPLVCAPELLAEAERLAAQFPALEYQHCLALAKAPRTSARPALTDFAARRAESRRAHRRTATRGAYTGWDR